MVSRFRHAQVGAVLAERILLDRGMAPTEVAAVMGAIGSHDPEEECQAVSAISAAVILADKSDCIGRVYATLTCILSMCTIE